MRKRNLCLVIFTQILILINVWYAFKIYFGLGFDAGDNLWPFSRYYLISYPYEIKYMLLTLLILLLFLFLKNNLTQKHGRVLITLGGYLIKLMLVISLISAMSSMHVLYYNADFNALLSISIFIIPISLILSMLGFIILVREAIKIIK